MKYVSLHTHPTFSYGDGYGTVSDHVKRVSALGMSSVAITDHGNVSGWVALEKACASSESVYGRAVKPIFGIEIYIAPEGEQRKCHMILLAMNSVGLQNINRIVTQSWKQFYRYPTVYWKDLVEYNDGIIALSGCADSELSCILLGGKRFGDKLLEPSDGNLQRAIRGVQRFQQVFDNRYYLEVQRFPGLARTCALNPLLSEISRRTGVLMCATSDVHYPRPEDNAMQRILHAAHRGGTVETADASWEYDILLTYPQSDQEIISDLIGTGLSKDEATQAVSITADIADRCNVELPKAPPVHFGTSYPKSVLRDQITLGWHLRISTNQHMQENVKNYKARLKHEYETICAREGFADYFLIVADLVVWAKSQGIAVGPGRGSSAGSLVCYLLRITEIDSMQFPMLFERFLDPTRTDPPDIDIDFDDERRDEVFAYAASKYGEDRVANIGTFTFYRGRNSLDDVGRVYRLPAWKIDSVKSKLIDRVDGHPREFKTLEDTYNSFDDVAALVEETPELRYAPKLEGNIRTFGVHAAGMVVSAVPLNEICATYHRAIGGSRGGTGQRSGSSSARGSGKAGIVRERQGSVIAFDKYDASYLGMLKIDALSLTTMGEIAKTCELAGISLEELYRVPLDDEKVMKAFRKGDVLGIFQFEGNTTRRILKQVAPTTFMHLSDVNALSRPGADDKTYITNKRLGDGLDGVLTGLNPVVRQHLSWTYGVVVYEEQILMILRDLGGFAPAELNRMRKVIHDKLGSAAFNEYYKMFLKGAATHGLSEDSARNIWDGLVSASGYAFNIAHSVSYSHIGYWQKYLEIHYPAAAYTAKLVKCGDDVRRGKLIAQANRYGIDVRPPDLLESQQDWTLTYDYDGSSLGERKPMILAGLLQVPGIGPKTAEAIIDWRTTEISRYGMDDFFPEWDDLKAVKGVGPKTIETIRSFCESGDPFGVNELRRVLDSVRKACETGELVGVPTPTHTSLDLNPERELVCYAGVVRRKKYYDAVESLQKRTKGELSYEDALNQLEDSHLLKYVALDVEDEYGEVIKVWVWRKKYPEYADQIAKIKLNSDVVIVQGFTSDFSGVSLGVNQMVVIDPYG